MASVHNHIPTSATIPLKEGVISPTPTSCQANIATSLIIHHQMLGKKNGKRKFKRSLKFY